MRRQWGTSQGRVYKVTVVLFYKISLRKLDLGLVPGTHMLAHNHLWLQLQGIWCHFRTVWVPGTYLVHMCACRQKNCVHKIKTEVRSRLRIFVWAGIFLFVYRVECDGTVVQIWKRAIASNHFKRNSWQRRWLHIRGYLWDTNIHICTQTCSSAIQGEQEGTEREQEGKGNVISMEGRRVGILCSPSVPFFMNLKLCPKTV